MTVDADELAVPAIDRIGEPVERQDDADLDRASNRFANVLTGHGVGKGDFASVAPRHVGKPEALRGEIVGACVVVSVAGRPGRCLATSRIASGTGRRPTNIRVRASCVPKRARK